MRVVSLVPSLTESVAATLPDLLVGATDWCTQPPELAVARVGGSKYPDLAQVLALEPDIVLLNKEENRKEDAEVLAAAGIRLLTCFPRTVDGALDELADLLAELGAAEEPDWLRAARAAWAVAAEGSASGVEPAGRRAVVPVWRRPWVILGSDTFAGDVLRRLGVTNLYAQAGERYPRPPLAELQAAAPELVVLPDEPYPFTEQDGPEAFPGVPCSLVSGRHLTWYGPSLAQAPALLRSQLDRSVTVLPNG
jgi:ABC-type Fe3+-hydroxamate transport system substrate-binding protein